jgi:N-acetylglucosamine-6-phosphate deacetylase
MVFFRICKTLGKVREIAEVIHELSVISQTYTQICRPLTPFQVLPSLLPRHIPHSASLLGAHVEGPYLHPSKKGAHNASLFSTASTAASSIYGSTNLHNVVKLVTLAPELPDSESLIKSLVDQGIKVSMGHSTATYEQGLVGLNAGASCLTHTLNAMPPFNSRDPGLAGLISLSERHKPSPPYYTVITDGQHLHPNTVSIARI